MLKNKQTDLLSQMVTLNRLNRFTEPVCTMHLWIGLICFEWLSNQLTNSSNQELSLLGMFHSCLIMKNNRLIFSLNRFIEMNSLKDLFHYNYSTNSFLKGNCTDISWNIPTVRAFYHLVSRRIKKKKIKNTNKVVRNKQAMQCAWGQAELRER